MIQPAAGTLTNPLTTVQLVGPLIQWGASILLLFVFGLLLPLSSQRRAVVTWMFAWVAQAVSMSYPALSACYILFIRGARFPEWFGVLQPISWSAQFVFLTAMVLGSLGAAGWWLRAGTHYRVLAFAAVAGFAVYAFGADEWANKCFLISSVVLIFGAAQATLMRARGRRRTGLAFLAGALTLYGTLSTIYTLSTFYDNSSSFGRFIQGAAVSSGYVDAIALAILSAAVIVIIVQEAFLDAAQAQEARVQTIAASESRLNGIIQAAQEAIITVSREGRIELVNGAAEQMFGFDRVQAIGQHLATFLLDAPMSFAALLAEPAGEEGPGPADSPTCDARGRRADGRIFALEFTVGRLRGEGRSGAVVVLHDTTERNAALAERKAFEQRMAESEKMMAIGRVVSGVAHELNNPLAVVLGQSEQMVADAPTSELRSGLALIHEQAHRARHIVKDLLAFVRHREEQRETIDLGRLVARTVASQLDVAAAHDVTLAVDMSPSLPPVLADRVGIEQVIVNLIDNGLDAAGRGGRVVLSARQVGACVELYVDDSGHGIAADIAGKIFEPFFSTKGPGLGTGLGLSVSRAIAEQQDGSLRLDVEPSPLRGARFVLALPASTGHIAARPDAAVPAFPRPPARGDGTASEVMLVDDEPSVRTTLARMFKRHGWLVREAVDGQEALTWLDSVPEAEAPAVILCDLKMPVLDGRGMFEQLVRRRPELAARVIFVTGDVVESMSNGFIAASGRTVVEKPFTIDEIARAVRLMVNRE